MYLSTHISTLLHIHPLYCMAPTLLRKLYYTQPIKYTNIHFSAWHTHFTVQHILNTHIHFNARHTHSRHIPILLHKSTLLHDAPTQLYRTPTSPHAHIQFNTQISTLLHDTSTLPYDRYSLHPLYCTHIHFTTQLFPSALFQQNNWLLLFCFWLDCNSVTDWLSDPSSRGLSVNPCP